MVVTTSGKFITARSDPKLVLISPSFDGNNMILSAPGMIDLKIDVEQLHTKPRVTSSVWSQDVETVDCGEDAAIWFSRFVKEQDSGLRLVFYPSSVSSREVRGNNRKWRDLTKPDAVSNFLNIFLCSN